MKIRRIVFDEATFGVTQPSLKMLRDTLVRKAHHRIALIEVPTNDACCAYLILDKALNDATFTGDGFRMDRAGEGGAGYRSAKALFDLFGLRPIPGYTVNMDEIYQGKTDIITKRLLKVARDAADQLVDRDYVTLLDTTPQYLTA